MHWIALQWRPDADAAVEPPTPEALGWWALQFTPRVAWVDEALLLEVSGSLRLWRGGAALLRRILESNPAPVPVHHAHHAIGLVALALLRQRVRGRLPPRDRPAQLPLDTLTAALPHLPLLARLGCRTWGDVHALPRAPMVRRFGADLRTALDKAWGLVPENHGWLTLPEVFDQALELPARVEDASALIWSASRLLSSLQIWLRARQRGVLAFQLSWRLDLKRLDGRPLPPGQSLTIRTAEPEQSMVHLRRLLAERLTRIPLLAPAVQLRLRSLDTAAWQAASTSFLPEDQRQGDPLHVFVERVGARLGPAQVLAPVPCADHRPERMQSWGVAQQVVLKASARPKKTSHKPLSGGGVPAASLCASDSAAGRGGGPAATLPDALAPTWLLREPVPLQVQADGQPCHHGPLRLLTGPRRVETGWWPDATAALGAPAARDYYIAQNPAAELLWIYRERATSAQQDASARPRWYLQGLYA